MIVGRQAAQLPQICNSLNELINWFQRNRINEDGDMLRCVLDVLIIN